MPLNKATNAALERQRLLKPFHIRLILAAVLIVSLIVAGKITGAHQYFTPDKVQDLVGNAGIWGYVLFIVIFSMGELIHVFGLIFVAAGVYAFGKTAGLVLGIVGGDDRGLCQFPCYADRGRPGLYPDRQALGSQDAAEA